MPVTAMRVLAGNGLTMLKAKRTIEAMLAAGHAEVRLPAVVSLKATAKSLGNAGVAVAKLAAGEPVDVKAVRTNLGWTQEQFALLFNLPLATVQHWEQGRELDQAANNYLRVILADPELAARAQVRPVE